MSYCFLMFEVVVLSKRNVNGMFFISFSNIEYQCRYIPVLQIRDFQLVGQ